MPSPWLDCVSLPNSDMAQVLKCQAKKMITAQIELFHFILFVFRHEQAAGFAYVHETVPGFLRGKDIAALCKIKMKTFFLSQKLVH